MTTTDVGPAPRLDMALTERVNLITGDNGLGKSFILDLAWWALTRTWAHLPATPDRGKNAKPTIAFEVESKSRVVAYESAFDWEAQEWPVKGGRPHNPGLVLYARVDGGFSAWDPARNYWKNAPSLGVVDPKRPAAFHFNPSQVWDGLSLDGRSLCEGLIRDWASWQRENGAAFGQLTAVLRQLSPSPAEPLVPGELTRVDLRDARDVPTLRTSYGKDVAVVHASAAVRRILALAYLLVWTWREHHRASEVIRQPPARTVVFLIDELEAHLHPSWQRRVLRALLDVVKALATSEDVAVQVVAVTHSPMLLASVEPIFDPARDSLWKFDLVEHGGRREVRLTKDAWHRRGDASRWLRSDVFDLGEARSLEAEAALGEARDLMRSEAPDRVVFERCYRDLRRSLAGDDPFWVEWRAWAWERGLLAERRA